MEKEAISHKLIIISDNNELASETEVLLVADYPDSKVALSISDVQKSLDLKSSTSLIFNFADISKAENFCLKLYRSIPGLASVPHKTVLLCALENSEQAYLMCMDAVFDDYLVIDPLQDVNRLKLCVFMSAKQVSLENKIRSTTNLSLVWLNDIHSNENNVKELVKSSEELDSLMLNEHQQLSNEINDAMTDIVADLTTNKYSDCVQVTQPEIFKQRFKKEADAVVEKKINQAKNKISKHINKSKTVYFNEYQRIQAQSKDAQAALNDDESFNDYQRRNNKPISKKQEIIDYKPKSILIIDDDEVYIKTLEKMLFENNYKVIVTRSGKSAFSLMLKEMPDLLLYDYGLPGMGGDAVFRMARILLASKIPPVIITVNKMTSEIETKMLDCGASDVVEKSTSKRQLIEKISAIIS